MTSSNPWKSKHVKVPASFPSHRNPVGDNSTRLYICARPRSDCRHTNIQFYLTELYVLYFYNLLHKFFILIHFYTSLHVSSTIMLIFRRTIVLTQHLVSSLSFGWLFSTQGTGGVTLFILYRMAVFILSFHTLSCCRLLLYWCRLFLAVWSDMFCWTRWL